LVKLSENVEVIDDFIRNFMLKNNMLRTLEIFQSEWYELRTKGIEINGENDFPDMYRKNEALNEELNKMKLEVESSKQISEQTKNTYDKLRKERD